MWSLFINCTIIISCTYCYHMQWNFFIYQNLKTWLIIVHISPRFVAENPVLSEWLKVDNFRLLCCIDSYWLHDQISKFCPEDEIFSNLRSLIMTQLIEYSNFYFLEDEYLYFHLDAPDLFIVIIGCCENHALKSLLITSFTCSLFN